MQPNPSDVIGQYRDLNNPEHLRSELADMAQGLDQQAQASRAGSAMAGAPYPEQFYRRCAAVMRAAELALKPAEVPKADDGKKKDAPKG